LETGSTFLLGFEVAVMNVFKKILVLNFDAVSAVLEHG
jgi:hypothetical protein